MAPRPRPARAVGIPGWMLSPQSPFRQPNRECLLAAGIVTTGQIHGPWNLSCRAVSHSGPSRCLPGTSVCHLHSRCPAMLRQLDCLLSIWLYGPAFAADGVELSRRLRNAGTPDVVAKGRQSPGTIRPATRHPSPTSILTFARRRPCGAQRLRSLKDSLENRVPGWTRRAWRPGGTGAMMTVALGGVTKKGRTGPRNVPRVGTRATGADGPRQSAPVGLWQPGPGPRRRLMRCIVYNRIWR